MLSSSVRPRPQGISGEKLRSRALAAPVQIRLNESVEVTVEHRLHVAGLVSSAFVLHELVRRKCVRAYLTAERDVALVARKRVELLAAFLAHSFRKARGENL